MADPLTVLTGIVGGAYTFISSLIGENWARYFFILGGMSLNNIIGAFTGFWVVETLITNVVRFVFGFSSFIVPIYYGVSALLITVGMAPVIWYMLRVTNNFYSGH